MSIVDSHAIMLRDIIRKSIIHCLGDEARNLEEALYNSMLSFFILKCEEIKANTRIDHIEKEFGDFKKDFSRMQKLSVSMNKRLAAIERDL